MKKRRLILIAIIITFIFGGIIYGNGKEKRNSQITNKSKLTQKEKLDDFEYMYKILKENYPYFDVNKRLNGVDWISKKDEYISRIKATNSDESFFNVLQSILSELNNGHTNMLDKSFYSYLKSIFQANPAKYQPWLKQLNNPKAVERYLSLPDDDNKTQFSANTVIKSNVKTDILEKDKVAYLAVHSFNTFNINGDMKIIRPYLKSISNYKTLIIDVRGNGGGDTRYWSDYIVPMLIHKPLDDKQYLAFRGGSFTEQFVKSYFGYDYIGLSKISNIDKENLKNLPLEIKIDFKYYYKNETHYWPIDSVDFKGKIYLLVDRKVFSAAEAFATFAKSTGFATLIGENTGGDGIGLDPAVCTLPNSGYVFRFTEEMGLTSDGTCNFEQKTEPDIKVSAKIGSSISNDEAVQAVLKNVD